MKNVHNSVIDCIGNTPIVKLNKIGKDQKHDFYVKLDFMNPGSSIKDRLARQLIADAVANGQLKPGGTIIETTSGNTGMGAAMIAAVQGFKCIFTMPDKVSDEKTNAMRALGAEVLLCPTAVEPDDPRSYYSVAKRLAKDTPNSFYLNQYDNPSNTKAHYLSTGPEIYEQMGNELDYLVACIGTGGTLCGTGQYLKEKNPKLKTIAVDPVGSIFYDYFKTGKVPPAGTYKVEGFGEDFFPKNVNFEMIDDMIQVNDQECFDVARELARKEGIFAGGSSGGAISAALRFAKTIPDKKTFLILLPDGGSRYLSKMYNDQWMIENGFLKADDSKKVSLEDEVRF